MVGGLEVALFIGWLVLLVQDDNSQIGYGREQRRARADHDINLPGANASPLIEALAHTQVAMDNGNAVGKAPGHALDSLGGKGYFWHQHDAALALSDDRGERLQVDLRLAASGNAV